MKRKVNKVSQRRLVIQHKRGEGDLLETRIVREGVPRLDPPGLATPVAETFPPP